MEGDNQNLVDNSVRIRDLQIWLCYSYSIAFMHSSPVTLFIFILNQVSIYCYR